MRWLAYLLFFLGILFLADAARDQHRGLTDAPPGHNTIARTQDPEQFQNFMASKWLRSSLLLGGGFIILAFCRRADRLDPFSTDLGDS